MRDVELIGSYWTLAGAAYPHTDREYSPFDFKDRVSAAAEAGFKGIGLWHADLEHILETRSLTDMQRILDDHDMYVELEFLTDWFFTDERRKKSDATRKLLLDAAEGLNTRHVKVGDFSGEPVPMSQMVDAFAELCAEAKARGTKILYEYMPFANIKSLEDTQRLFDGAAADNGGVIFDLWHLVYTDVSYDTVAAFPAQYVLGAELNDGPREKPADLHDATVNGRQFCGDGDFDIAGFIAALDRLGYDGPYGIEVLNSEHREKPLAELVTRAYNTTVAQFRD